MREGGMVWLAGRLEGMWHESKGWWDQAERVYDDLLEINPANQVRFR